MHNLLSHPSDEGQIWEKIASSPKQDLLDLQLSQEPSSGPSEQVLPRRSERIHLQQEKNLPSRPVARSQTRRDNGNDTSTLVYDVNEDNHLEDSELNLSQDNREFDYDYLTISAEPVEENDMNIAFSMQTLTILNSTNEALKDPTGKESMNDEYKALIDKNIWEVVLPPPDANIVRSCWTFCKTNQDGATRLKSQVVAQSFTQTFGIDYEETDVPITQLVSLWTYVRLQHVTIGSYIKWTSTIHMWMQI